MLKLPTVTVFAKQDMENIAILHIFHVLFQVTLFV